MHFAQKCLLTVFIFLALSTSAFAQNRADFFDQPASVVLPDNYKPERAYPMIIFLPATNFTSSLPHERFAAVLPKSEYIILLPVGAPQSSDYLPDFGKFVKWYEERLLKDIADARSKYNVDAKRIIVYGHSLGGDLVCALTARNPALFAGFITSGTRCGYSFGKVALQTVKNSGLRGAFYIGDQDQEARTNGMKAAYNLLRKNGIETSFELVPNHRHIDIPEDLFAKSLAWILDKQTPAVAPQTERKVSEPAKQPQQRPVPPSTPPSRQVAAKPAMTKPPVRGVDFTVEYDEGNPSYQSDELPLKRIKPVKVTASSTLKSKNYVYDAKNVSDDNPSTAWCKGAEGNGTGESLLFEFGKPVPVTVISFTPFFAKSDKTLANNNRVKKLKIEMEGGVSGVAEFSDASWCKDCQLQYPAPLINFHKKNGNRFISTRWVKFTILDVYPGAKFSDTCISDINVDVWNGR